MDMEVKKISEFERVRNMIINDIIPRYDKHDLCHGRQHIMVVLENVAALHQWYTGTHEDRLDIIPLLAAAAYHDIKRSQEFSDEEDHHEWGSAIALIKDRAMHNLLGSHRMGIAVNAVLNHRSSNNIRDIASLDSYSKILSDANKTSIMSLDAAVCRMYDYNVKRIRNEYKTRGETYIIDVDEITDVILHHLRRKFSSTGYAMAFYEPTIKRLEEFQKEVDSEDCRSKIKIIVEIIAEISQK
jgi:HD superfamily phosphodiesterase